MPRFSFYAVSLDLICFKLKVDLVEYSTANIIRCNKSVHYFSVFCDVAF